MVFGSATKTIILMKFLLCSCLILIPVAVFAQDRVTHEKKFVFYFKYNSSDPDSSQAGPLSELKLWLATVLFPKAIMRGCWFAQP